MLKYYEIFLNKKGSLNRNTSKSFMESPLSLLGLPYFTEIGQIE